MQSAYVDVLVCGMGTDTGPHHVEDHLQNKKYIAKVIINRSGVQVPRWKRYHYSVLSCYVLTPFAETV